MSALHVFVKGICGEIIPIVPFYGRLVDRTKIVTIPRGLLNARRCRVCGRWMTGPTKALTSGKLCCASHFWTEYDGVMWERPRHRR